MGWPAATSHWSPSHGHRGDGQDPSLLALKADGTVAAWGSDIGGQSDVPIGLGDVTAIAADSYRSLALSDE